MRGLSYIIALVFVLTGPSLAGSANRDALGIVTPVLEPMAAVGQ
jgi:hypothetical protein